MMIQNAAFIPDPVPMAAMQQGMGATAAPATAGKGIFQELLQGMQPEAKTSPQGGEAATTGAAVAVTADPTWGSEGEGSAVTVPSAPNGLAAETGEGAVLVTPAPQKGAAADVQLQLVMTWQALKADATARSGNTPVQGGAEAGAAKVVPAKSMLPEEEPAPKAGTEAGTEARTEATLADAVQQAMSGALAVTATTTPRAAAAEGSGSAPSGIAVAQARVESNMQQRNDAAPAEAGAQALSRLAALQKPLEGDAAGNGGAGEKGTQSAPPELIIPATAGAAARPSQEAGSAKGAPPENGSRGAVSTGATEGAQVEVTAHPAAGKVAAADVAVAREFTPTQLRGASSQPATAETGGADATSAGTGEVAKAAIRPSLSGSGQAAQAAPGATEAAQAANGATEGAQAAPGKAAVQGDGRGETAAAGRPALPVEPPRQEGARDAAMTQQRREPLGEGRPAVSAKENEAVQQPAVTTATPEQPSGSKGAPAVALGMVPEKGTGRDGAGSQGGEGHPAPKGEQHAQLSGAAFGAQVDAAAELEQPQAGESVNRRALHENILSQVKEGAVTHDGKGNGQMSIRLNPGELGELKIQVRMEDNRFKVEVQADNRMVKDLLMSNLDSLKEALSGKNLNMDAFNVSTGGGGFNGPLHEERGREQQSFPRFARGGGYDGPQEAQVKYMTAEVNTLLDVRF